MTETIFLVAFFKFDDRGPEYGFERIDLQHIWKTEKEAREGLSFCDEAGWYEGALIEEVPFGWERPLRSQRNRIWLIQQKDGEMKEVPEHKWYKDITRLIG